LAGQILFAASQAAQIPAAFHAAVSVAMAFLGNKHAAILI
jgi:hypothetical protein